MTDDEIEALRLDRDEWRARASYAESEMSAAFGLPPTFGPAPGEAVRTVAELRKIADTQTKKAAAWEQLFLERNALREAAEARLTAVRAMLERNGCDCYCGCDSDGHDDDCERCFACRIGEAVGR